MFRNALLDKVTRVHPVVVPTLFVPIIFAFGLFAVDKGLTSPPRFALWLLIGYVTWTLTEYWLHRIVFHFEPEKGIGARLHWMIHGVHHDHPNDPLRLVMPPSASIPLGALFTGLFHWVLPAGQANALCCGFFAGYLAYDMTHYMLHHHVPRSPLGRRLREHHMRHHFQDDSVGFGISAPWWDTVFGTAPRSRAQSPVGAPEASDPVPQTRS